MTHTHMKIALSSMGPSAEAHVSEKFGRCPFFIVYDTETKAITSLPNTAANDEHGAGPAAAQLVIRECADMVLTGALGEHAEAVLKKAGMRCTTGVKGSATVREAIEMFLQSPTT